MAPSRPVAFPCVLAALIVGMLWFAFAPTPEHVRGIAIRSQQAAPAEKLQSEAGAPSNPRRSPPDTAAATTLAGDDAIAAKEATATATVTAMDAAADGGGEIVVAEADDPTATASDDGKNDANDAIGDDAISISGSADDDTLIVAGLGDVLLPINVLKYGRAKHGTRGSFAHMLRYLRPLLARADHAFANFEGTSARLSVSGKSGPPLQGDGGDWRRETWAMSGAIVWQTGKRKGKHLGFNYPPAIARDLRAAGVDVVSTANNHAFDRGPVNFFAEHFHRLGAQRGGGGTDPHRDPQLPQIGSQRAFVAGAPGRRRGTG